MGDAKVEFNRLKLIQTSLENAINTTIGHLNNYPEGLDVLQCSNSIGEDLKNDLLELKNSINSKRTLLKNKENLNSITDFKSFKTEMILIQDNIQKLRIKLTIELEKLDKESIDMQENVDYYTEKIDDWCEKTILPSFEIQKTVNRKLYNQHQCKEMKDFIDFVKRSNGHENGWRKEDHLLFVKFRTKYDDFQKMAVKLHAILPDISVEEIRKHDEWYKKYVELNRKKKEAVKKWRELQNGVNKTKKNDLVMADVVRFEQSAMKDVRESLKKWREEKEGRLMENQRIELEKKLKMKEVEEKKRKYNEELKKVVAEWKLSKQEFLQKEKSIQKEIELKEKRRRATTANKLIKEFQSQDDIHVMKIQQQKINKIKKLNLPLRSKSSSSQILRDPKRLFKPTQQWINRVHDDDDNHESKLFSLQKLPKLRVPDWRKQ